MKGIGNPVTDHFESLFVGSKNYQVPRFQRDYSWTEKNWDELWNDIRALEENPDSDHYLGYLVLLSGEGEAYDIVDGQQRLTTLSLLILAILKAMKLCADFDENSLEKLKGTFIGEAPYYAPGHYVTKLKLNRNNDSTYGNIVNTNDSVKLKGLNVSEKLMCNCFDYFFGKVSELHLNFIELAEFVRKFSTRLFFTKIPVTTALDAYRLFETLNSRGVELSSTDLLKNHIFQLIAKHNSNDTNRVLNNVETKWNDIYDKLPKGGFPEFLRAYWNGRYNTVKKKDLYREVKAEVHTATKALDLVNDLEAAVEIYKAILSPSKEFWQDADVVKDLQLLDDFGVTQPFPMLLTGYANLKPKDFKNLLQKTVIISFRYNLISKANPNSLEPVYNKVAKSITTNKKFNILDFKPIYIDDNLFHVHFLTKEFKPTAAQLKIARYILTEIEQQASTTPLSMSKTAITIEHILPQGNHKAHWHLSDEEFSRLVNKLGNLTLLHQNHQDETKNFAFDVKQKVFAKSKIDMTKRIYKDYSEWTEKDINNNQIWQANKAKTVWKINFPKK